MPLFIPFIIAGGVALAGAWGSKKGYDGVQGVARARTMVARATAKHAMHVSVLDSARQRLAERFAQHDDLRQSVARDTLGRMVELLQALERRGRLKTEEDFARAGADREEVREFAGHYVQAGGLLKGGLAAAGAASGASAAATGLVSSFATAGTGTAISGLSGAAANSAVMAWLGGGSLAAGGFGMAGGAVVMGGIAVAPVLLVGGLVLAAQGEKAVEQATKFAANVKVSVAKIGSLVVLLRRAERRAQELGRIIRAINARAHAAMSALEEIVPTFDESPEHIERLRLAMILCGGVRQLIDVRVLDDEGQLDGTSETLIAQYRHLAARGSA